jgi:hypothetical protein
MKCNTKAFLRFLEKSKGDFIDVLIEFVHYSMRLCLLELTGPKKKNITRNPGRQAGLRKTQN